MKNINVDIQLLDHNADLNMPAYATEYSAGMDLEAAVRESIIER